MSGGDWLVRWAVISWVTRPILRLLQFIRLQRGRASDPDDAIQWRSIFHLLAWAAFAAVLLVLVLSAVGSALSQGNDLKAVIATVIVAIAGLIGLIAVIGRVKQGVKALPNLGGGATIRLAHYLDAPPAVKKSMQRIYRTARKLRREQACQRGLIDERELQRLVYSAGQQAVLSSELRLSVRDLRGSHEAGDTEAVSQAESRITEITRNLKEIEASLNRTAASARHLSAAIVAPERQQQRDREQDQIRAMEQERLRQARARLFDANSSARVHDKEITVQFEEKVSGLRAGYQEVDQMTERVLRGPALPQPVADTAKIAEPVEQDEEVSAARDHALALAKLAARGTANLARSAAKRGAQKLRTRLTQHRPGPDRE